MKHKLLLIFLLLVSWSTQAQTLLQRQSFEGTGDDALPANGYTASTVSSGNSNIYFLRSQLPVDGYLKTTPEQTSTVNNINGTWFWASENVRRLFPSGPNPDNDVRANPAANLTLNPLNVAGKTGLSVTVALADAAGPADQAGNGGNTIERWETGDYVRIQYNLDGNGWVTIGQFVGDNPGTGGAAGRLRQDMNRDGISNVNLEPNSPILTQTLTDYTFPIPGSGSSLQVRVQIDQDGASEEFGFDNIRVYGIAATSAAPVLSSLETAPVNYAEGQGAVQLTNGLTVSDPDSPALGSATVSISTNFQASEDRLVFTDQNGITGSFSTGTGVLTLSGAASVAAYQAALRSVQYQNADNSDASPLTRTVSFNVTDNASVNSNTVTRSITVTPVLDPAYVGLPYVEPFETDGEGTRYSSNHFFTQNAAQFQRTSTNPVPQGTTFTNLVGSYYWVGVNTASNSALNPTGVLNGTVTTKRINTAGYTNLHFQIRVGASTRVANGNLANWTTSDYFQLRYRTAGSSTWTAFGLFRGTSTTNSGGVFRQDANPTGTGAPTGTQLTEALQNVDFTLPTTLNGQTLEFQMLAVVQDGVNFLAFDQIQVTGTQAIPPTVATTSATSVTTTSAVLGGNVTADGGADVSARGVVYSATNSVPTVADTRVQIGTGTGSFLQSVTGLTSNTIYYVRAFATNSSGTGYGSAISFTTLAMTTATPVLVSPANGSSQNPVRPTYTGTAPASSTVTVYVDGSRIGSTTATSGGSFSFAQATSLTEGTHNAYATAQLGGQLVSPSSNTTTFSVDATPPTVVITSSAGGTGSSTPTAPLTYTVTFSEPVSGFDTGDIANNVTNVNVVDLIPLTATSFRVTVVPLGPGAVSLTVPANVAIDAAGNGNLAAGPFTIIYVPNQAPTDISLSSTAVAENVPVGTTVGSFSSTDADTPAQSFTYALVSGQGDTDNALFAISGNTLRTATGLDYETKPGYTIRVRTTDSGNPGLSVEKSFTISVTNVNELTASITNQTNVICFEGRTGSATVIVSGENGPFSYDWLPGTPAGDGTPTVTGLQAGSYSVVVTALGSGFSTTALVSITQNEALVVSVSPATTAVCGGTVSLSALTSATNPSFTWSGTTPTSGPVVTVSSTGVYSVTLTNGNGCTATASASVTVNSLPVVSITGLSGAYCRDAAAVTLTASPAGGRFTIDGAPTTEFVSATLAIGAHAVGYTYTDANGCVGTTTQTVTTNPLPVVSITGLPSAYCRDAAAVTLTATPAGGRFTIDGTAATQFNPAQLLAGTRTVGYTYTDANGCTNSTTQSVTVNALPVVSITSLSSAYCQDTSPVTLTGNPTGVGGSFTIDGTSASTLTPMSLTVGQHIVGFRYTDGNGCSNATSQTITIKATPPAPSLLTQAGQAYPASQSAVTVDLNTGNVTLVAGNCAGLVNWTGSNSTAGTGTSIIVPTTQAGAFTYRASCTIDGCTSPQAMATVTVGARLTVLHRDVDNYADNNAIQPLLVLQNNSTGSLPLARLTLRYYLTVENGGTLGNLTLNYAQVGNQNVRLRYIALNPTQTGATGYVEYSFTDGAGSLAAGANSGSIQGYFTKSDYGALVEPNDYSYNPFRDQLTGNLRITAYYDNVLIAGLEPGSTTQIRAVRALTESKNGPSATQINTYLEVRNEGNVAINYSDLKARYYFTSDGNERLQVEVDEGNISTQLVKLNTPVNGADYYLEIHFNQGGQLAPGTSTGTIRYRISKPDGGRFNQANDYSYQEQPQDRSQNSRVVVLVSNQVVWGTLPAGAPARLAFEEAGSALTVKVMGNPIQNDQVSFEVTGAEGQPLQVQLLNPQGRVVSQQLVPRAEATQWQQLSVAGQAGGLLLLQVSTPNQTQTVKVIKAQ